MKTEITQKMIDECKKQNVDNFGKPLFETITLT